MIKPISGKRARKDVPSIQIAFYAPTKLRRRVFVL